jgi:(R,R)-butanediol dehydrogenase/meso-butanediol dehydrogenase/diacetyl reductase
VTTQRMRVLAFAGPGAVAVEMRPIAEPGPSEVRLRVAFCGVCGSDIAEYLSGPHQAHVTSEPHRVTGHRGPVVLGHELAGYVVDCGPGVEVSAGALLVCAGGVMCGRCDACLAGRPNLCRDYHIVGMARDGGLAEYCVVPASSCVVVDSSELSPAAAALAQPMAIAIHALRRASVRPGDRVAIVGIGGVGAFLTYAAHRAGAEVTALDLEPERRELAARLGALQVLTDAVSASVFGAYDHVFEVTGTGGGLITAKQLTGRGGHLVLVGIQGPDAVIAARQVVMDELTVTGAVSLVTPDDLSEAVRVLAGRADGWHDVAPMAFPLSDVEAEGLSRAAAGRRVKTLFAPALEHATAISQAEQLVASSGFVPTGPST